MTKSIVINDTLTVRVYVLPQNNDEFRWVAMDIGTGGNEFWKFSQTTFTDESECLGNGLLAVDDHFAEQTNENRQASMPVNNWLKDVVRMIPNDMTIAEWENE